MNLSVKHSAVTKDQIGELLDVQITFNNSLMLHVRELFESLATTEMSRPNISLCLDFYEAINALTDQVNDASAQILSKRAPRRISDPLQ